MLIAWAFPSNINLNTVPQKVETFRDVVASLLFVQGNVKLKVNNIKFPLFAALQM